MICNINHKKSKGFTLVEILVAISILSIIILAINRIYFAIMDSQKDIIGENFVQSDLEYFTRLISNNIKDAQRGDGVLCSVPEDKFFVLNATSSSITFIKDDECLEFYLSDDDGVGRIKMNDSISATDQYITSSKTDVLGLVFEVEDNIETGQPLVTILTKGAPISDSSNFIYIQNSVSVIENVVEVDIWVCGEDVYDDECNIYGTVLNTTTNECWLDRNLGATQVATSSTDSLAYGDLYQWGRLADGHQIRTSITTSTLATSDIPGHNNFITNISSPWDWRNPQNNNLWQGVDGINNPCPSGWRIPTEAEWEAERGSWSSNDSIGAFASPLKLTVAGVRDNYGGVVNVGSYGYCWSSSISVGSYMESSLLQFGSSESTTYMTSNVRVYAFSVRCIKD